MSFRDQLEVCEAYLRDVLTPKVKAAAEEAVRMYLENHKQFFTDNLLSMAKRTEVPLAFNARMNVVVDKLSIVCNDAEVVIDIDNKLPMDFAKQALNILTHVCRLELICDTQMKRFFTGMKVEKKQVVGTKLFYYSVSYS